jgi:flagellar biosynthetic protein FlhB
MAEETFQEKTEPVTPKRREELRKEGRVAKSVELTTASILLIGTAAIYVLSRNLVMQMADVMKSFLSLSYGSEIDPENVGSLAVTIMFRTIAIVAPIVLVIMIIGVISNVLQTGFIFTLKPLVPKGKSLNPFNGVKRIGFSQRSMVEFLKSFLKMFIVGTVGYYSVKSMLASSVQLVDSSPSEILSFMGQGAFTVIMKVSMAFAVLAAADYYFQRRKFEQETRMTKQEVKEEQKQLEGDPAVKGRIRREMMKRHRLRMMQAVPKADVVVTNPTHYAVAIKYDAKLMAAPKVVAKGKDLIAQKIKEIAMEHNVPIMEDKPLAQLLYKTVDVDEQIPPDLFKAVAQILAYIYKMKKVRPSFRNN